METAPSNSKKRRLSGPVPYIDSHVSTKNRRISDVVDKHDSEAIIKAAIRIFKNRGQKNAAKALEILDENPNDFSNLHGFISEVENKTDKSPMMTPRQGLFHMLGMYTLLYIPGNEGGMKDFPSRVTFHDLMIFNVMITHP